MQPKLVIFASGTANAGGSGFENLVEATESNVLDANIVAVVSNHEYGGVRERACRLGIPFVYFSHDSDYAKIVEDYNAEWVALSGWLKLVKGLDPKRTFNIHPALLSQMEGRFGGKNMYGHRIHEEVKKALDAGEINNSGFSMHFVTSEYDRGPIFFEYSVPLARGMSAEKIAKAVNKSEHLWQPKITNMVVHEEIRWDGENPKSLVIPKTLTL